MKTNQFTLTDGPVFQTHWLEVGGSWVKAADFLREHEDHPTVRKLRWNEPLGSSDLDSLEALLANASFGTPDNIRHAKLVSEGLGLFVRSLIGLDRSAAKAAFSGFLDGRPATANQIEFINMIVDHLAEQGWMDPGPSLRLTLHRPEPPGRRGSV